MKAKALCWLGGAVAALGGVCAVLAWPRMGASGPGAEGSEARGAGVPTDSPATAVVGSATLPETVPEACADASGRVRRTVFPEGDAALATVRAAIARAGGEAIGWNPAGGYDAQIPRAGLAALRAAGCRLAAAPLPVTPALRRAVAAGGEVEAAFICAEAGTAARLQGRLGGMRVEASLRTRAPAEAVAAVFAEEGGILAADVVPVARSCGNVARGERFFGADALQLDATWMTGQGEAVGVFDTGISSGVAGYLGREDVAPFHPALRRGVLAIAEQPWPLIDPTMREDPDNDRPWDNIAADEDAHGTHVAGCVVSDGTGSVGNRFRGIAPGARLFFQNNGTPTGALATPADLGVVFGQAYAAGARLHSNSWGAYQADGCRNNPEVYSLHAWSIDRFT